MIVKLFEEYSGLYKRVSFEEWSKKLDNNSFEEFTQVELNWITSYFRDVDWLILGPYGSSLDDYPDRKELFVINVNNNVTSLSISKLTDEWYYVYVRTRLSIPGYLDQYSTNFYKCDTFQGVIECLKNYRQ